MPLMIAALILLPSAGCTTFESRPEPTARRTAPPPRAAAPRAVPYDRNWRPLPLPPAPQPAPARAASAAHGILARSVKGQPIPIYRFGNGGEVTLILGGIHGSEPTSAFIAERLVEELEQNPALYAGRTVVVVPRANPDGLATGSRHNARGVDLNRNFPASNWRLASNGASTHGTRPLSEPEAEGIRRAVVQHQPAKIVSIHSIARGRHCVNFDGPADGLARAMAAQNGYRVVPSMGYPTPGSFGTWAGIDHGIPTITLELPRELHGAGAWRENRTALLAAIRYSGGSVGRGAIGK